MFLITWIAFVPGCGSDVGDLFALGGAGGMVGSGNGTPTVGTGTTDASSSIATQSANAAQSSNDAAATATTDGPATTADAATASAVEQASSSTGMPDPTVFCGQDQCDLAQGESCCLFGPTSGLTCKAQCDFIETRIACDGPSDCNGESCCGTLDGLQQGYEKIECDSSCNSDDERVLCNSDADCEQDQDCVQSSVLPMGFQVCRDQQ